MMKEIFASYGPIWELWWDGANGEGPNGKKQVYDWDRFKKTIKTISPNTLIFSDVGPHVRWVGNEKGIAGETNWNYLDTAGFTPGEGAPPVDTLNRGNVNGKNWIPAECDVSIRPGWFYHQEEDDKVKTPEELFQLWLKSVGRGANLLLNVPPDRRGLINEKDSAALIGFKMLRDKNFKVDLTGIADVYINKNNGKMPERTSAGRFKDYISLGNYYQPSIQIIFKVPTLVNCIVIKEWLVSGQRIQKFYLSAEEAERGLVYQGVFTTVGRERILTFPTTEAKKIVVRIMASRNAPLINEVSAYLIDENLIEK
jgi:alpha-L-fucosidase